MAWLSPQIIDQKPIADPYLKPTVSCEQLLVI